MVFLKFIQLSIRFFQKLVYFGRICSLPCNTLKNKVVQMNTAKNVLKFYAHFASFIMDAENHPPKLEERK